MSKITSRKAFLSVYKPTCVLDGDCPNCEEKGTPANPLIQIDIKYYEIVKTFLGTTEEALVNPHLPDLFCKKCWLALKELLNQELI